MSVGWKQVQRRSLGELGLGKSANDEARESANDIRGNPMGVNNEFSLHSFMRIRVFAFSAKCRLEEKPRKAEGKS